jgi:hypothetical protein
MFFLTKHLQDGKMSGYIHHTRTSVLVLAYANVRLNCILFKWRKVLVILAIDLWTQKKSLIDIDVTALKPGIIYEKNVQS